MLISLRFCYISSVWELLRLVVVVVRPPVPSACDDVMGFFLFQRISLVEVAGPKQQALISLSDKRDVGFLAKGLVDLGYNRVFVSCVPLLFDVKLNAEVCLQSFPYCL